MDMHMMHTVSARTSPRVQFSVLNSIGPGHSYGNSASDMPFSPQSRAPFQTLANKN